MLELIGFCAVAYLVFKFAPAILEVGFKFAVICLGLVAFFFILSFVWGTILIAINQEDYMGELLEIIEDLKSLDANDDPIERKIELGELITKYQDRFDTAERDISRQMELDLVQTICK